MSISYNTILIRYGELVLKGHNRKDFTKRLYRNVKAAFRQYENLEYQVQHDRMFIILNDTDPKALIPVLSTVFGISSFSLTIKCANDIEAIVSSAFDLAKRYTGLTFKVNARRNDKRFPIHSDQINRLVATTILCASDLSVDVHNPQLELVIEVRSEGTYIMDNKISGAGGFPVGSQEKALLLLSGGIDSPVAGYLAMKKGLSIECLHFESAPYTSVLALNKVRDLVNKLALYKGRITLHIAPFTKLQLAINQEIPESYRITIMRRMMLRIAQRWAEQRKCLALVSGESVGQVASQTLSSLKVIEEVIKLPVLRPLVSYDKSEIIALAKKIMTYEISSLPYEDCCTIFTPHNPSTKPKSAKAEAFESRLPYNELIEECLMNIKYEVYDFITETDGSED